MRPTPAPTRGPYSLVVKGDKYSSFSFLLPSDSPDGAVHWPDPEEKPGGKQAVNVHPTDEPPGAWSRRKETWSESGGGNGSRPHLPVNGGRGRGVGTWRVKEHRSSPSWC